MTKQLKTIEILNPSKSATCSMWRYPESAKIFQYRGMDFDGFRVVRANIENQIYECYDKYFLIFFPRELLVQKQLETVWPKTWIKT